MAYNYNVNPAYQVGAGAYGKVPGAIGIPPNIYEQLGDIDPLLAQQTGTMGTDIQSELEGNLSNATMAALQQNAAQFGVKSGSPMSQFSGYYGLSGLKDTREARQRQGIQDYLSMLKGLGATLTPQELAADIASRNATMAAAPDPQAAAEQQMSDWQTKFNATSGGAGAGGGGYTINPGGGSGAGAAAGGVKSLGSGGGGGSGAGGYGYGGAVPAGVPTTPDGSIDYSKQFTYTTPSGSTLVWTGQDWTDLFGNPYDTSGSAGKSGYFPVSHGSMYMGANTGQGINYGGGYTYMGQQPDDAENWLSMFGVNTTGLSQDDIDLYAYMYGYTPSEFGSDDSSDLSDYGPMGGLGYSLGGYGNTSNWWQTATDPYNMFSGSDVGSIGLDSGFDPTYEETPGYYPYAGGSVGGGGWTIEDLIDLG